MKTHVLQGPFSRPVSPIAEPVFAAALVDRHGNLLGAGPASRLQGEVEVPPGLNLRKEDLRYFFDGGAAGARARRFPLVSATWLQVKGKRVRLGVYMELGDAIVTAEGLDLDVASITAILSGQMVA
jgi:hypothetical protein